METKMLQCPDCGEYLGDIVDGVVYKFGSVVTEAHVCEFTQKTAYESGKREIEKRHPHFFDD